MTHAAAGWIEPELGRQRLRRCGSGPASLQEFSVDWSLEFKHNEEFEAINSQNKKILIENERLQVEIKYQNFIHSDLAYCITTHVAQGSKYDFPHSIYEHQSFEQSLLHTSMSRSTKTILIELIINQKY